MNDLLSYCGLVCGTCPIYRATRERSAQERLRQRAEIAKELNEHYGMNCSPEDVSDCDGCRIVGGRIFSACLKCGIRTCAIDRKIDSCALCPDFACDKLQAQFEESPQARTRLEELRGKMV
jgi:hypothetical protein